jgi:hypothetical protein
MHLNKKTVNKNYPKTVILFYTILHGNIVLKFHKMTENHVVDLYLTLTYSYMCSTVRITYKH